jgi:2-amino-4-hydroxy-6-hydroxymethyldihydropteridine diphosphokinase
VTDDEPASEAQPRRTEPGAAGPPEMERAYVGLGANVGDARSTLPLAVRSLAEMPGIVVVGVSRLYRTKPVGVVDQPDFLNAVVALDVPAPSDPASGALALLARLKDLERRFGRPTGGRRWGPRPLDLDLLLFGTAELALDRPPEGVPLSAAIDPAAATRLLEVPHPEMRRRLFVLAPLADIAPMLTPPGWNEMIETARLARVRQEGEDAVTLEGVWNPALEDWATVA